MRMSIHGTRQVLILTHMLQRLRRCGYCTIMTEAEYHGCLPTLMPVVQGDIHHKQQTYMRGLPAAATKGQVQPMSSLTTNDQMSII